ncbi:MAG: hypothetical protein IBJ18_06035 [Phycisphaerales bacterium]|nr:hypothetical protein [Phycisphaerales bacterium]
MDLIGQLNSPRFTREDDEPRLVFPAKALEIARKSAVRNAHTNPPPHSRRDATPSHVLGRCTITASIDATLDQMQRKLDQLKDDVENVLFTFPVPDPNDHNGPSSRPPLPAA